MEAVVQFSPLNATETFIYPYPDLLLNTVHSQRCKIILIAWLLLQCTFSALWLNEHRCVGFLHAQEPHHERQNKGSECLCKWNIFIYLQQINNTTPKPDLFINCVKL